MFLSDIGIVLFWLGIILFWLGLILFWLGFIFIMLGFIYVMLDKYLNILQFVFSGAMTNRYLKLISCDMAINLNI